LTAAYEIKRETGDRHNIILIDKNSRFTFIPSLVWAPLGKRGIENITFPLQSALESKGIEFLHTSVERIDPERQVVELAGSDQTDGSPAARELHYDYLLVATGSHVDFAAVEGLGPYGGYTESICNAEHAEHAGKAWREFLKDPGPIIIGASQGAACYGAAYEFDFNVEYALCQAGLRDMVPITYITSEPFAGHFGIGGLKHSQGMTEWFLRHTKINWVVDSVIEKGTPGAVHFKQGKLHSAAANNGAAKELSGLSLPFKYAMIIPPFCWRCC
jgi:sulfide:quinone oxidoreductase